MRRLSSLVAILLTVVFTLRGAAEPEAKIRLVVDAVVIFPRLTELPKDYHPGARYMTVAARLYIENYGTTSVTVPTRIPPDGKPMSGSIIREPGGGSRSVWYSATYQDRHGKKVQPAATAFEPVTLQPGEQAQVGVWEPQELFLDTLPLDLNNVTFVFEVADDLAARFGWWSGKLEVRCDFSEQPKASGHSPQPVLSSGG